MISHAKVAEQFPAQSGPARKAHLDLYPHQRDAIEFLKKNPRGYLELKMGAGKSRIVVEALDQFAARRVLVICPKAVVSGVWPEQFDDWSGRPWRIVPSTRVKGSGPRKAEVIRAAIEAATLRLEPTVVVVNYDMARSDAVKKVLERVKWDAVVLDEAHKIKSPKGKTSRAVAQITRAAKRVIAMTGTPMPHSPLDIWAQFRAVDPMLLGPSFWKFRNRYSVMGGYKNKQILRFRDLDELTRQLSPRMFSPPADSVDLHLPPSSHRVVPVELEPKARKLYDSLDRGLAAKIQQGEVSYANGLVKLLRMQQICSGLAVVDVEGEEPDDDEAMDLLLRAEAGEAVHREEFEVSTAKREALCDLIESMGDEPVIVFGVFRHDMRTARAAAEANGRRYGEISGIGDDLAAFRAGNVDVLGVQINSGAEGIDLTRARYCVYLSTGFSGGDYQQSLARTHRPGQTRPVTYYHLRVPDTVDELVARVLHNRQSLVADVLAMIAAK